MGILAGVLFVFLCPNKPCGYFLLTFAQVSLGVGEFAIVVINPICCAWMLWIGIGLTIVGIGLFLLWRARCEYSWCKLLREASYLLGGAVITYIGVFENLPILNECINPLGRSIVGGIIAVIGIAATACTLNEGQEK